MPEGQSLPPSLTRERGRDEGALVGSQSCKKDEGRPCSLAVRMAALSDPVVVRCKPRVPELPRLQRACPNVRLANRQLVETMSRSAGSSSVWLNSKSTASSRLGTTRCPVTIIDAISP